MQLTHVQSPALDMGTKDCMEWSLIVESPEHSQVWPKNEQTSKQTKRPDLKGAAYVMNSREGPIYGR